MKTSHGSFKRVSRYGPYYKSVCRCRYEHYGVFLKAIHADLSKRKNLLAPCSYDDHAIIVAGIDDQQKVFATLRLILRDPSKKLFLEVEESEDDITSSLLKQFPNAVELSRLVICPEYRKSKKVIFELCQVLVHYVNHLKIKVLLFECPPTPFYVSFYRSIGFKIPNKYQSVVKPKYGRMRIGFLKTNGFRCRLVKLYWKICLYFPWVYRHRDDIKKGAERSLLSIAATMSLKVMLVLGVFHILRHYM